MKIALTSVSSPDKFLWQASRELGMSRTSLYYLLYQLNLKIYCPRLLHDLLEDDPDSKLQFCKIMCNQLIEQPDQLSKTVWTDETCFKLSGPVNRHNSVYWANENPHVIVTMPLNQPSMTVWMAYPAMVLWFLSF